MRLPMSPHLRRAEVPHEHLLLRQLRLVLADEVGVVKAAGWRHGRRVINRDRRRRPLVLALPIVLVPKALDGMVLLVLDGYDALNLLNLSLIHISEPTRPY